MKMENRSENAAASIENNVSAHDFSTKTWKEDVVLLVEGRELHAAKNVLAYISPVFEAMFSHPFSEKDKAKVELPGKSYETFLEFMRCIYPGQKRTISEENVFKVLPLADEYQVSKLKKKCEKFLRSFVCQNTTTTQEIVKCLAASEKYLMDNFKDTCVQVIEKRPPTELVDAEIDPVCQNTMYEVMKRIVARQQNQLVKILIVKDVDEASLEKEFESFSDSKGAVIELEAKEISKMQKRNGVSKDTSHIIELWSFKFSVFVKYHRVNNDTKFGIFLAVNPPENISKWSCSVKGRISLRNSGSNEISYKIEHRFTQDECDWGFSRFAEMKDVLNPSKGFIADDTVQIAAVFLANRPVFTMKK